MVESCYQRDFEKYSTNKTNSLSLCYNTELFILLAPANISESSDLITHHYRPVKL